MDSPTWSEALLHHAQQMALSTVSYMLLHPPCPHYWRHTSIVISSLSRIQKQECLSCNPFFYFRRITDFVKRESQVSFKSYIGQVPLGRPYHVEYRITGWYLLPGKAMKACLYCADVAHSRTTVFWSCKVTTNNGQASQFFVLAQFQRLDSASLESEPGFMPTCMCLTVRGQA